MPVHQNFARMRHSFWSAFAQESLRSCLSCTIRSVHWNFLWSGSRTIIRCFVWLARVCSWWAGKECDSVSLCSCVCRPVGAGSRPFQGTTSSCGPWTSSILERYAICSFWDHWGAPVLAKFATKRAPDPVIGAEKSRPAQLPFSAPSPQRALTGYPWWSGCIWILSRPFDSFLRHWIDTAWSHSSLSGTRISIDIRRSCRYCEEICLWHSDRYYSTTPGRSNGPCSSSTLDRSWWARKAMPHRLVWWQRSCHQRYQNRSSSSYSTDLS